MSERTWRVLSGDCLEVLRTLPENSVDSCITDPPYGLEFMGRDWDKFRLDDPGTNRYRGERAGNQGEAGAGDGSHPARGKRVAVAYGGGKHPATFRCTGCGKRDQYRNDHDCTPHARWVRQIIDPHAAPPTALAFGEWCRQWGMEVKRVLKPGGFVLAFGGTRTYHRLACGLEDAGFEVRDMVAWLYGSGFPKSMDLSKAMDKHHGATREVIGQRPVTNAAQGEGLGHGELVGGEVRAGMIDVTAPATDDAKAWQGWGTALKPALEPVCLARKPMEGTTAENVLAHGPGALNIDGCRIEAGDKTPAPVGQFAGSTIGPTGLSGERDGSADALGRWPANVAHDGSDEVVSRFPSEAGGGFGVNTGGRTDRVYSDGWAGSDRSVIGFGDSGSAARFFYTAKADAAERKGSNHPTIKPLDLMRWLVRLVTPPGGVVLDPFAGSGTTGQAAMMEGFGYVLIEREAEYLADIERRLNGSQIGLGL